MSRNIPRDREDSIWKISLCKGKRFALEREKYRGLKQFDQVMKVLLKLVASYNMCASMTWRLASCLYVASLITSSSLRASNKKTSRLFTRHCVRFLSKREFDHVPRLWISCPPSKLGVEEWLVPLIYRAYIYENARSKCVFVAAWAKTSVWVHQGWCLSRLLFITILETRMLRGNL